MHSLARAIGYTELMYSLLFDGGIDALDDAGDNFGRNRFQLSRDCVNSSKFMCENQTILPDSSFVCLPREWYRRYRQVLYAVMK